MTHNARWLAAAIATLPLFMTSAGHARGDAPATPEQTAPPPAEPVLKPSVIATPQWLRRPTGAQVSRAFPKRALQKEIEGRGQFICKVNDKGALTECKIIAETPEGYGFGEAALTLSKYFTLGAKTADGVPVSVEGATVNVGIPFRLE